MSTLKDMAINNRYIGLPYETQLRFKCCSHGEMCYVARRCCYTQRNSSGLSHFKGGVKMVGIPEGPLLLDRPRDKQMLQH